MPKVSQMNEFSDFCKRVAPLDDLSIAQLQAIVETKRAKKGAHLLNNNAHSKDFFFIKKGLVKLCFNGDGSEFIMRFFEENSLLTDIEGYAKNQHSKFEVVALEDTDYLSFSFYQFEQLCAQHHRLETFFRKFMTMANVNMIARVSEMLEEDAKKRYSNFITANPKLLNRISLGDLSNYLGITQVSLSRIRAQR